MSGHGDPVQFIRLADVRENPWNPNAMSDDEFAALIANMDRVGFNQPILVRALGGRDYEVIDGAHRLRAARELGLDLIPAVVRNMGDDEAKAQTVAMNTVRGTMDEVSTARLLADLDYGAHELAEFTGYTMDDLAGLDMLLDDFGLERAAKDSDPEPIPDGETWVNVTVRCPESLAVVVRNELDRLKALLDLEGDHLALEVMAVQSSQVPDPMVGA